MASVFRINKTSNYTVMSNYHLREKNMSLKAKGLLSLMLSLPDDWDFSRKGLISLGSDKEDSVVTALKELKKYGYLVIKKLNSNETASKRFEYEYHIFEFPQTPMAEKQSLEIPALDFPVLENQPSNKILNNQILNNEILNNKTTTTSERVSNKDPLRLQIVEGRDSWGCKIEVNLLISDTQIMDLHRKLTNDELHHYLERMQHMLLDDYRLPCSHYEYIMRMVEQDRGIKND